MDEQRERWTDLSPRQQSQLLTEGYIPIRYTAWGHFSADKRERLIDEGVTRDVFCTHDSLDGARRTVRVEQAWLDVGYARAHAGV